MGTVTEGSVRGARAIPFFFKQWGGIRKSKAGRAIDGKTYDGIPYRVQLPVMDPTKRLAVITEFERRYRTSQTATEPLLISE